MDTLPVNKQTFDIGTGELVSEGTAEFQIMPAPPGTCQCCAVTHETDQPHNAQSLHYQYTFYGKEGRWPNWLDAMAHCPTEIQRDWTEKLEGLGVDVKGGKIQP